MRVRNSRGAGVRLGLLAVVMDLALSGVVFGAYWDAYTITATKVTSPPEIDGVLEDTAWRKTAALTRFSGTIENAPARVQTKAYLVYDDEALYVAFDCEEPKPSGVKTESQTTDDVWSKVDDIVAVFLVPEKGERYQFAVTAAGVKFDKYTGPKKDLRYRYAIDCTVATKTGKANWTCEMKLPFKALRIGPQMGKVWRINFCRSRPQDKIVASSWAETAGQWKNENSYGTLRGLIIGETYLKEKPALRLKDVQWSDFVVGRNTVTLKLRSPRSSGKHIVGITSTSPSGKAIETKKNVEVKDRGIAEHVAEFELAAESGKHQIAVSLADADTGRLLYRSPPTTADIPSFLHAFCDRNYYTREKDCRVIIRFADAISQQLSGKVLKLALTDSGGRALRQEKGKDLAPKQIVSLPIGALPPGVYAAQGVLLDGDHELSRFSFPVEKYPPAANEVKIDREREIFLVNGKPFFMRNWMFISTDPDAGMQHLRSLGFNCVLPKEQGVAIDKMKKALDTAHKHGLMLQINWRNCDFVYSKYRNLHKELGDRGRYGRHWRDHFEEVYAKLEELLPHVKDHPALFGYYVLDEPGNTKEAKHMLGSLKKLIKKHDPYHPVWFSFCRTVQLVPDPYDAFYDFVGIHLYWAPTRDGAGVINKFQWWVDNAKFATRDLHVPMVLTTQSGIASMSVRERTSYEHRMQLYLGLIHGVTGGKSYFKYNFSDGPVHMANWQELQKMNAELDVLFPVISEPTPRQVVSMPPASCLHALLKVHDKTLYLLTANSNIMSQEVTFRGNFVATGTRIRELFGGEAVESGGDAFSDTLRYYDSRVYAISDWKLPADEDTFKLELAARALPEKLTPGKTKEWFASSSGAYYLRGQRAILVYGKGNTLESVARDVGDEKIFSYDTKTRKATASMFANVIRIGFGGELFVGDGEDPSKGETLEFIRWPDDLEGKGSWRSGINNNGYLKVANSRLVGNGRTAVSPAYIGMVEIINSEISGFTHTATGKDAKTGEMTIRYFSRVLDGATFSADGRVTVSYYGPATDGLKRYSKGVREIVDWSIDDR